MIRPAGEAGDRDRWEADVAAGTARTTRAHQAPQTDRAWLVRMGAAHRHGAHGKRRRPCRAGGGDIAGRPRPRQLHDGRPGLVAGQSQLDQNPVRREPAPLAHALTNTPAALAAYVAKDFRMGHGPVLSAAHSKTRVCSADLARFSSSIRASSSARRLFAMSRTAARSSPESSASS